jgi:hypothetical protein
LKTDRQQKPPSEKPAEKPPPRPDVSKQATLDPKLSDANKTPGSGMVPDKDGDAPTG